MNLMHHFHFLPFSSIFFFLFICCCRGGGVIQLSPEAIAAWGRPQSSFHLKPPEKKKKFPIRIIRNNWIGSSIAQWNGTGGNEPEMTPAIAVAQYANEPARGREDSGRSEGGRGNWEKGKGRSQRQVGADRCFTDAVHI